MRGMGCESFTVAALSCLKSSQNRRLPSFFFTMTTVEAQGLLEGRMTPLDNICWTWAISSRRTARFWRRYGWRSRGPSVSMVCCRSGVQPRSSSPWFTMSLNSWRRAFSCRCWVDGRCAGTGSGRQGLEAAGGGGASATATISTVPTVCLVCKPEQFWAVIVDRDPHFRSTGEHRYPRHKRRENFLWAKVDVFAGPWVMATDQARCFGGDVDGL